MSQIPSLHDPSFNEAANARDDAIPFRVLERAHRRMRLAQAELVAARTDLERAFESMQKAGYQVRESEPGDELEVRAPIPPAEFRAEVAA